MRQEIAGYEIGDWGDEYHVGDEVEALLAGAYDPYERFSAGAVTKMPPRSMPARPPGGTVVRETAPTKSRLLMIPFDSTTTIAAAASTTLNAQPQVLFRPERLVIDDSIASSFVMNDFKVGKNSQFATSGSAPCSAFKPGSFGVRLKCDTAQVSNIVSLNITNISAGALRFLALLFGESVE